MLEISKWVCAVLPAAGLVVAVYTMLTCRPSKRCWFCRHLGPKE